MVKPFAKGFVRPAEELDFEHRPGEIAEDDPAARHPRRRRQAGARRQAAQRRQGRAQVPGPQQPEYFQGDEQAGDRQQRQGADLGQKRRGQRQPDGGGQPGGGKLRFPEFQQQHKGEPKSQGRENVVVDGVKGRLGHERDERRHGEADENIFRKDFFRRDPAQPDQRGQQGDIQKPEPVQEPAAIQAQQLAQPPPRASETVIQGRLRGFMIFNLLAPEVLLGAEIAGDNADGQRPRRWRDAAAGLRGGRPEIFNRAKNGDERQRLRARRRERAGEVPLRITHGEVKVNLLVHDIEKRKRRGKNKDVRRREQAEKKNNPALTLPGTGGWFVHRWAEI